MQKRKVRRERTQTLFGEEKETIVAEGGRE